MNSQSQTYKFEGRLIKLTEADYQRWRQSYRWIDDLDATLQLADDYYADNPPPDGKWFFPVSRWLQKENGRAMQANRSDKYGVGWW